jgi:NAD(P)H-dependent FMN reductase
MNGSGKTMLMRHLSVFNNITVNGSISLPFEAASDQNVIQGTLLIGTGKTLVIGSGLFVASSDAGDIKVFSGGRIGGVGGLVINSGSSISVMNGVINTTAFAVYDQHVGNGNRIAASRYDSTYTFIKNNSGGALTPTQEFSPGTTTFSGDVLFVGTAGPLHTNLASTNSRLVFRGSLLLGDDALGHYPLSWTWGSYPLVFSGSNLQALYLSGGTVQNLSIDKASNYVVLTGSGVARNVEIRNGGFAQHGEVIYETVRLADKRIPVGLGFRESEDDEWPAIVEQIKKADVILFATPVWWGQRSSLMQRVIERMDALDEEYLATGRSALLNKVAGVVITGSEDGAQQVLASILEVLTFMNFTIPPQCCTYWVGEVGMGPKTDRERRLQNKAVDEMAKHTARNLMYYAKLMQQYPLQPEE